MRSWLQLLLQVLIFSAVIIGATARLESRITAMEVKLASFVDRVADLKQQADKEHDRFERSIERLEGRQRHQ